MNKSFYVGKFTEQDIISGADRQAVEAAKEKTGLKYVKTKATRKSLEIWLCDNYYETSEI